MRPLQLIAWELITKCPHDISQGRGLVSYVSVVSVAKTVMFQICTRSAIS